MKRSLLRAGFIASLMLGAAVLTSPAAFAAAKQPPMTPTVNKALAEAQKLYGKQDFQGALAAIQKAQEVSSPTPYDKLMTNRFLMQVQIALKDLNAAGVAAEAAADMDPADIPDDQKDAVYKPALQLALNSKHYDKALKYAKALEALPTPQDAQFQSLIMQAHYFGGDLDGAKALAQKHIDAAKAAGQRPARNDYDVIMSAQVKAKDEAGAESTLEQLVADYNDPEDWAQMIGVSFGAKGMREIDYIYLGRLAVANHVPLKPSDATLIGNVANSNRLALYGDAAAMQKLGGPAPDAREAADRKSVPDQIKIGQSPKGTGEFNAKLAEVLYGYGMYPEAEAAATLAAQKGGTTDPNEPAMVLAQTQAAQGKYADSLASLEKVKPTDPAQQRVVRLWTYYVKSKLNPATTAAQ